MQLTGTLSVTLSLRSSGFFANLQAFTTGFWFEFVFTTRGRVLAIASINTITRHTTLPSVQEIQKVGKNSEKLRIRSQKKTRN